MKYNWKTAAKRLKLIRGARHLTEHDAALIAGVTVRTWRLWESGKGEPRGNRPIRRFCRALDVSSDWLYGGETIEEVRRRVRQPLGMDVMPEKHRAMVQELVAKADQRVGACLQSLALSAAP